MGGGCHLSASRITSLSTAVETRVVWLATAASMASYTCSRGAHMLKGGRYIATMPREKVRRGHLVASLTGEGGG